MRSNSHHENVVARGTRRLMHAAGHPLESLGLARGADVTGWMRRGGYAAVAAGRRHPAMLSAIAIGTAAAVAWYFWRRHNEDAQTQFEASSDPAADRRAEDAED